MNNKQLFVIIAFASIVLAGAVIGLVGEFASASNNQITGNIVSEELEPTTKSCGCGSETCTGSCGGVCDGSCGKTAEEKAVVGGSCNEGGSCGAEASCGGSCGGSCGAAKEKPSTCACGK